MSYWRESRREVTETMVEASNIKMDRREFDSEAFIQEYVYEGNDLGAGYDHDKTVFKIWAPTAQEVLLCLHKYGSVEENGENEADVLKSVTMIKDDHGVWKWKEDGDLEGIYYTFLVTVDGVTRETADPYAKACGVNGKRSMVIDLERTNPAGWELDEMPEECADHPFIYELHIGDFSNDPNSGICAEHRGKYLAFTHSDSTAGNEGRFPTCINYLKSLGVTYVHLLPTFDYATVDETGENERQFNWGYDPLNYNVPEGSYATNARDGHVRVKEFKEMVMALHQAGMGVIMDVVYNHTFDLDSIFQRTVPDYYYRCSEEGQVSNGSACGNDTASEREMFRRYMVDSVCYWAREYHIDGFRFDLMGLHDVQTMNEIRRHLDMLDNGKRIRMYGEPWAASQTAWMRDVVPAVPSNLHLLDPRIAIFCDRTRDGIKGHVFEADARGYVNGNRAEVEFMKKNVMSAVCAWSGQGKDENGMSALAPSQIINYVSAHDDWTLWDKFVASVKNGQDYDRNYSDLIQMNKMAAGIVMTCLGTPFFQAGEEFARTKYGCDNSYNSSPELNQLDWKRAMEYESLTEYYKYMMELRRTLPVLERVDADAASHIQFLERPDAVIGFVLADEDADTLWKKAVVYYNPYESEIQAQLPECTWRLLTDGDQCVEPSEAVGMEKDILLKPRTVTVLGYEGGF